MEIRRQTEARRGSPMPHSAPVRNQVKALHLRVEQLASGVLRVSTPQARGWAVVCRTPAELNRAISLAFVEAQVASYAAWRGRPYDLDVMTDVDPTDPLGAPVRTVAMGPRSRRRFDVHSPAEWTPMDDGRWRSPTGRVYRPDCAVVQSVIKKREILGLVPPQFGG